MYYWFLRDDVCLFVCEHFLVDTNTLFLCVPIANRVSRPTRLSIFSCGFLGRNEKTTNIVARPIFRKIEFPFFFVL